MRKLVKESAVYSARDPHADVTIEVQMELQSTCASTQVSSRTAGGFNKHWMTSSLFILERRNGTATRRSLGLEFTKTKSTEADCSNPGSTP